MLILLILNGFLFTSCIENDITDHALDVTPVPVEANGIIRIRYDAKHPLAKFTSDDSLYATILIRTATSYSTYRILLLHYDEYLYNGVYKVPANAVFVDISVGPREWIYDTETFTSAIYGSEVPVEHSLPQLIYSTNSFEAAREIFTVDENLYPQSMDRYIPYWKKRIIYGIDTNNIRNQIDSVMRTMSSTNRSKPDELTGVTACALAYFYLYDFTNAKKSLDRLESRVNQNTILPLSVKDGLEAIWGCILEPSGASDLADAVGVDSIASTLSSIAVRTNDLSLLKWVIRNQIDHSRGKGVNQPDNSISEYVYNILMKMSVMPNYYPGGNELIYFTTLLLYDTDKYHKCKDLIERNLHTLRESLLWIQDDVSLPVTRFPDYGIACESQLLLGKSYMALRDTSNALKCLTGIVQSNYRTEYQYAISASIEYLAKYFIQKRVYDSTEKYIAYSIIYNTKNATYLYEKTKTTYADDHLLPDKAALISKYYKPHMNTMQQTPHIRIVTDKRTYDLGGGNNESILMFFSSKSCSVCKDVYPLVFAALKGKSTISNVIFITDEEQRYIMQYGKVLPTNIMSVSKLSSEILRAFAIRGYPAVVVIKGAHVLYKGTVNAETTVPMIESILARNN